MSAPRPILLNPGPVVLSERVRKALLRPDLCHREAEFSALQNKLRAGLLEVYQLDPADWAAVLLTGSGTAALEAMLTSLAPPSGRVLILANGVYGERLARIAEIHHIDHAVLWHEWGEALRLERLEAELAGGGVARVAVVQHETTTGRLNDIERIAGLCARYGDVPLFLDGVSSFGAERIEFERWNIAATAATANKCLHGVPGLSFVITRRRALPGAAAPARTLYLDLAAWLKAQDAHSTPFTPCVQVCYALAEALDELREAGGWRRRQARYRRLMEQTRAGLRGLGIRPLLPKEDGSCVLSAFHLPPGLGYQALHDRLKAAGFIIYAGQGAFAKSLFRIACMGEIKTADIERLIAEVGKIMPAHAGKNPP